MRGFALCAESEPADMAGGSEINPDLTLYLTHRGAEFDTRV